MGSFIVHSTNNKYGITFMQDWSSFNLEDWEKKKAREIKRIVIIMEKPRHGKWKKVEHLIFLHILNLYTGAYRSRLSFAYWWFDETSVLRTVYAYCIWVCNGFGSIEGMTKSFSMFFDLYVLEIFVCLIHRFA